MAKVTKAFAKEIGRKMPLNWTWDEARDYLDQATGADLDCVQIDLLTDWAIEARQKYHTDMAAKIAFTDEGVFLGTD